MRDARRAVAYMRVSTGKQVESGLGLEAQRAKLEALATIHDLSFEYVVDEGVSGKSMDGRALAAVLQDAKVGKVGVLAAAKQDRITRSVSDLEELLVLCERYDVRLLIAGESVDTGSAWGRLVLRMKGMIAQFEREIIGERTREALQAKKARGEHLGAAPYGWKADGRGKLMPNETERQIIRVAADKLSWRQSIQSIAMRLNELGYTTRSGGPFTRSGVRRYIVPPARELIEEEDL